MKNVFLGAVAALAAVSLAVPAIAQNKGSGKYANGIFERPGQTTDFTMPGKAKGKMQIKPSKKDLDGGWTIQLNVKGIDCASVDSSDAGKCGLKGFPVGPHYLELNILALGTLDTTVAVAYEIEGGKTKFVESGKNKTGVGAGGALVSILFNTVIGIGDAKLHEPGSDVLNPTTGCDVIPLPAVNTCLDGEVYAIGGILVGEDFGTTCTIDADCTQAALVCSGGSCVPETCTIDAECDEGGGTGGTGQCNCGTMQCCDPGQDASCETYC